ncbi:MAG: efflux RND transporter periplasmic adaptor subunit [Bacteroidota bacterium]
MKVKLLLISRGRILFGMFVAISILLTGCGQSEQTRHNLGTFTISMTVNPDPPAVGLNTFTVKVADNAAEPLRGALVHFHYSMPGMSGMPAMQGEIQAEEAESGSYKAEIDLGGGGQFPWNIRIELLKGQQTLGAAQWQVTAGTKGVKFISAEGGSTGEGEIDYYTCTMHPSVKEKEPGTCPICGMDLVPVYKSDAQAGQDATKKQPRTVDIPLYQQQLIGVQFDTVKAIQADKNLRTVGIVVYDERKLATVNLKFSGWVEKLFVDYVGRRVKKGEPLFTIYSPELVSTQEEYLQSLSDTARSYSLVAARSNLVQKPASQKSYSRTAEERLLLWGLSKAQIDEFARRGTPEIAVTFYSPMNGYVIMKNILEGSKAKAGTDLYTIADLSTVWVHADAYEFELPFIAVGQQAIITLSYDPQARYSGKVDYIYPTLNKKARTARVRIVVPNPDMKLLPNMYTNVEIRINMGIQLTIAETSVLDTGNRQIVFVDRGSGRFEPREVKIGPKVGQRYTVLDGLEPGEVVVKSGNFLIDAEAHVQGVLETM